MKVDGVQDVDIGMVSGEVPIIDDMEVESPQDMDGFVIADKQGNEVVMEEVAATQEKVVEKLKTLGPEQLVKATRLMGEALMTLGDSVAKEVNTAAVTNKTDESAAAHNSTAKDFADPAASEKVNSADVQDSTARSSDKVAAEAMVLLSKKTTEVPSESSSQHTSQPIQSLPQQPTSTVTSSTPRIPQKGVVIREPAAQQKKIASSSSTDKGKGKLVEDPKKIMFKGIDYSHIPFHFWPK